MSIRNCLKPLLTNVFNKLKIKIMKQQTAVEFLQESLSIHFTFDDKMKFEGIFQQAKEMEKEQILKAGNFGQNNHTFSTKKDIKIVEKYYKETYTKSSE